jgi:DNA repair exonuclease SbcCD ATPase subunit
MINEESIMIRLNKKRLFTKTVIALLLTTGGLSVHAKTDLRELTNELEIMTSILQTSLRQNDKGAAIRTRSIDVTYLANQGVVFDISTTRGSSHFNFEFSSMPMIPPVPPVPTAGMEREWVVEFENEEWAEVAHEAMEHAHEAMEEARDKLRDLNERSRDYNWEIREYERKRRDLEFEMRNADSQSKKNIQDKLTELDKEIRSIQLKQKEAHEFASQLEKEQKQKAEEKAKALNAQINQFVTNFEKNVSSALCKYGAGIKALAANENVSFVLSNFGNSSRNSPQDRIYVFRQNDVQDCVKDKLDAKKLLSKAEIYTF